MLYLIKLRQDDLVTYDVDDELPDVSHMNWHSGRDLD